VGQAVIAGSNGEGVNLAGATRTFKNLNSQPDADLLCETLYFKCGHFDVRQRRVKSNRPSGRIVPSDDHGAFLCEHHIHRV
jgi:hypothetical protein